MSGPGREGDLHSDPHAERVLSQALRAMAGDGRRSTGPGGATGTGSEPDMRWSPLQVLLFAALIGVFLGIVAGITWLLA